MRFRVGGQPADHISPAPPEPAPKPADQPSHSAWHSRDTAGFLVGRTRPGRDQQPRRRVPARTTGAAVLSLAGPGHPEIPDEGREIREVGDGDICGGREMLQAERLDGPRQVIPEDLSDPSFLGAGEHGGRYRSRSAPRGPVRVSSPRHALRRDCAALTPRVTRTRSRSIGT